MIIVVLRFFFVYGSGQRSSMLIPRLVDNVLDCRPILLRGPEGMRTNPIHVDDAAAAIDVATTLQDSQLINVAGPEALSLHRIGMLIGELTGRQPLFEREQDADPGHLVGNIERMIRLLGAPQVDLRDGLRRMVAHHGSQAP